MAPGQCLSPFPWLSARHQLVLQNHGCRAGASLSVPVYYPAFGVADCAYPWRDGLVELTPVAGYILRWFSHIFITY